MKRKIISFCTAVVMTALCIPSASAATVKEIISALPNYEAKFKQVDLDVDSDIELQRNGGTAYEDGPITVQVPKENPSAVFDYKATLYMKAVRDEFLRYWNSAKLLCNGDTDLLQQLDNMPVTGEFTVSIKYPKTMTVPASIMEAESMAGFNEAAKNIFKDPERKFIESENKLEIKIKVKSPSDDSKEYVTGKELFDNLDTYLGDLTLTCEGVTVNGVGTHRIAGAITGYTKIGEETEPISTVNYTAVQITTADHPKDQGRNTSDGIYEDVVLMTPAPTPGGGSTGGGGGGGSGSGIIAGGPTGGEYSTPAPAKPTIIPSEPVTSAELNYDDHYAYIIGYPEGDVRPSGSITRAEVATIFFRMLTDASREELWTKDNSYPDVSSAEWFNNAISTMSAAKIVNGYEDGTFRPNGAITRAEFAAIAARFAGGTYSGPDQFSDISGHWAASYINKAAQLGWIHGYEDGTFGPDRYITRAEAMTLVNNVLNRQVSEEGLLDDMVKWPDNTSDMWYYTAVQEATNSHYYDRGDTSVETWTSIRTPRDWAALETELSNAHSAGSEESVYSGE